MISTSSTLDETCSQPDNLCTVVDQVTHLIRNFATQQNQVDALLDQGTDDWIIHIDDDQQLSQALRIKLESRGLRVVLAEDGKVGVRRTFMGMPKAIILDFEMPNGNGDEVLQTLKSNRLTKDIPVILLSGKVDTALASRMQSLGAAAVFSKPYDFEELFESIKGSIK